MSEDAKGKAEFKEKCPECHSDDTEYVFDWMERRWFVCHHCGYEKWVH